MNDEDDLGWTGWSCPEHGTTRLFWSDLDPGWAQCLICGRAGDSSDVAERERPT